jgi:spermidine/putrescine-binding protein
VFKQSIMGAATVVAAIALVTGIAGSASAGTSIEVVNPTGGAKADFFDVGEHLQVVDMLADGHSAVAELQWNGRTYDLWATGGANTSASINLSITDGTPVKLRACTGNSGSQSLVSCSSWMSGEA